MIKRAFEDQSGASSIFIVLLMLVLIVFGLAIFSTALSNKRLADRHVSYQRADYLLDAQAHALIADVYRALADYSRASQGEKQALDQMAAHLSATADSIQLPDVIATGQTLSFDVSDQSGNRHITVELTIQKSDKTAAYLAEITTFKHWQLGVQMDDIIIAE